MNDPLLGPRIKLDRANHHLVELERTERQFFDQNPCRIIYDTQSKPGRKLAKIILDARPPEIIHVLAGELIYQLRSALDQTAVAFARLSSGPTKPKHIHFPTGDSFKGFVASCKAFNRPKNRLVGNLRHFDCDLRKAILRTKPYDGGNEALRAVFRMANIDKHMDLIAIDSLGGIKGLSDFTFIGGGIVAGPPADLNEGVVFSDMEPDGKIIPNHPNAKINVAGQITIGDVDPSLRGKPLVRALAEMVKEVRGAHGRFEDVLIGRGDMAPLINFMPTAGSWHER